jgi:hypothetical protein
MSRFRLCLALALSAAFAISLVNSLRTPPPAAPVAALPPSPTQEATPRPEVALNVRPAGKAALLELAGSAAFPDGTILRLELCRHVEKNRLGRLEPTLENAGGAVVEIRDGAFSWEQPVRNPGIYTVRAELREHLQPRDVLPQLPRAAFSRSWELEVLRWSDDLVTRLPKELASANEFLERTRTLARKLEEATSSTASWKRASGLGHDPFMLAFMLKEAEARYLFPAVHRSLLDSVLAMSAARPHFFWRPPEEGGGFGGAFDLSKRKWVLGPDEHPFSFQRLDRFLEEAGVVARREYALWILNDVRRAGVRDAVREAAREGPAEACAVLADLEAGKDPSVVEAALRGEERPVPLEPAPEPPHALGWAARRKKRDDAKALLETADRLWDEVGDRQAPGLYRQLLIEFPDVLDDLQARARVANRARN